MTRPRRTFTRTAAALAAYDAAGDALETVDAKDEAACTAVVEAWDATLAAVGEAFAADTLDINPNGVGTFQHFGHLVKFARQCVAASAPKV